MQRRRVSRAVAVCTYSPYVTMLLRSSLCVRNSYHPKNSSICTGCAQVKACNAGSSTRPSAARMPKHIAAGLQDFATRYSQQQQSYAASSAQLCASDTHPGQRGSAGGRELDQPSQPHCQQHLKVKSARRPEAIVRSLATAQEAGAARASTHCGHARSCDEVPG